MGVKHKELKKLKRTVVEKEAEIRRGYNKVPSKWGAKGKCRGLCGGLPEEAEEKEEKGFRVSRGNKTTP